jgi:hypothetical protein
MIRAAIAGRRGGSTEEKHMDIESNILRYIRGDKKSKGIGPDERYASFDYCFIT